MSTYARVGCSFPPFKLTPEQAALFAAQRDLLVSRTLTAQNEFQCKLHKRLNPQLWRVVKQAPDANVQVFVPTTQAQMPPPCESQTCTPNLVGIGTMRGTLDEVMLGLTAMDTTSTRAMTSTLFHNVLDARVLATLQVPTATDCFRYLGIKWLLKGAPRGLGRIVRPRDFMYLEATGVIRRGGKRFGFLLLHSVGMPAGCDFEENAGIVRGYGSFCAIFEEDRASNQVELFCKAFVDARGGLTSSLAISSASSIIVSFAHALEHGRMKKLAWMREQACRARSNTSSSSNSGQDSDRTSDRCCRVCCSHLQQHPSVQSCSVCRNSVCSTCTSTVQISGTATMRVCFRCLAHTRDIDARDLAFVCARSVGPCSIAPSMDVLRRRAHSHSQRKIHLSPIHKRPPFTRAHAKTV